MKIPHHRADLRSIAFVLASLALTAVQWTGAARHPALFAASIGLAFIACIVNHNHQHHPTFAPPALNQAFGVLLTWSIGQPASAIIPMHNLNHHVHNNHMEDHVRASIVRFRWNLLNLLAFPIVALAGYARVKSRMMRAWRRLRPDLHRRLVFERLALCPVLAAMLAARPLDTLLYVAAPWVFGQWGILAINHLQHDGCDPDSEYAHARDFTGRFLNWWTFNNGYHTAHHLRPDVHWSRLPELHASIRDRLDPRLERRSLPAALVELYVWPGRRPSRTKSAVEGLPGASRTLAAVVEELP